jgi:hypothetical protein
MSEPIQQPFFTARRADPAANLLSTTARWLGVDEDLALGCECADPTLQIERWRQEVAPFPASSA